MKVKKQKKYLAVREKNKYKDIFLGSKNKSLIKHQVNSNLVEIWEQEIEALRQTVCAEYEEAVNIVIDRILSKMRINPNSEEEQQKIRDFLLFFIEHDPSMESLIRKTFKIID